jgi:iron complex outermembrane receptor protein
MKNLLFFIIVLLFHISTSAQNGLSGKITDAATGTPVSGAVIYIQDIRMGAMSKEDGSYNLTNIPKGTYMVEAHLVGYMMKPQSVNINGNVILNLQLVTSSYEEQEVVVTGNATGADIESTPQPITEVSHDYLFQQSSSNVIDAIAKVPGVSAITDGQSISKPVIRGLGYNRVVVVNDGIVQQGQQWGDEFGIEVDPNSVERVEILKGPASLVYGSDAISGVINLLPEKTLPEGQVKGDILTNYQTNNGLMNVSGHIAGNNNGIAWSGRVSNIMAHAYQNKNDGYVLNSQFSNFNYDGTIGIHKSWGFSQLHYSYFDLRTGIVDGTRDSASGKLIQQVGINGNPMYIIPTKQEYSSYTPLIINQIVKHYKIVWDNSISLGENRIIGRFGLQRNSRQEFNDPTMPDISNISYLLNTLNYDARFISAERHGFNFTAGANGMYENSQNKGTLLLIPEYQLFDIGGFAIANKKIANLNLSAGVRYDVRTLKTMDAYIDSNENPVSANTSGALHRFARTTSNFKGISGSIGSTYNFAESAYIKVNVARGFRAPNIAEMGSNGIHDGTVIYEKGDPNLKPEQSMQIDIAPGIHTKDFELEVDGFMNKIDNFIYTKALLDKNGNVTVDSSTAGFGAAPVFKYTQGSALLQGGEVVLDIHPSGIKWLDLYAAYSMVNASLENVPDSIKYIPFTPPARLQAYLTLTARKLNPAMHNSFIRFGMVHSFEQSRIYLQTADYTALNTATSPFEYAASRTPTKAYTLLSAGIGADIMKNNGQKACTIFINVDNILNEKYMDYMSRFKYLPVNFASNPHRVGVYNLGRNISFKLLIPVDFR